MVTGATRLICGDYFRMYRNIKLLCWTPGTNTVLQVNHTAKTNKVIEEEIRFAVPRSGVGRLATEGTNFQLRNELGLGIQCTTWLT